MTADEDDPSGPIPEGAAPYSRAQKAVLAAVVVVGLLIMAGVGVVIVTIVSRLSDTPATSVDATAAFAMPAEGRLALPAGAVVEETSLDGRHLAVRYRSPTGAGIVIYDLATGETLGRVTLGP